MRPVATIAILLCCALTARGEGRPWSDSSGTFHVVADLVDAQNGRAYLKESNGRTVPVTIARLSKTDRDTVLAAYPAPQVIEGQVTAVQDGDTLTVVDGEREPYKIRLASIDAPESPQAFGTASKKALSDLVLEKAVRVEWREKDIHGRIVGNVFLGDRWINRTLVEQGHAWHYRDYSKSVVLAEAEAVARLKDLGLWADTKPTPPWEFRHPVAKAETPAEAPSVANPLPLAETPPAKADTQDVTVYITSTGTKYHAEGCRHLAKSSIAMSLKDASERYQPCSVCHPPTLTKPAATTVAKPVTTPTVKAKPEPVAPVDDPPMARSSSGDGPVTGSTATGIPTYTGPRGGQYHYSKNGNKVYEKKKK